MREPRRVARLAGFEPASVVCEVMNDDGTMARLPELEAFAAQHLMKVGTIADLIRYRMENEATVQRMRECSVTTEFGDFRVIAYHDTISDKTHLALVKGESPTGAPTLVRVHVQRSLLDLFADTHGPGHWTLQAALQRVAGEGAGVVVILNHAESSEDLLKRIELTHKREIALEPPIGRRAREELRTYGLGSQILADLGVTKMRVLGRPMKAPGMSGFGLEIVEYIERERPPRREGGSKTASA